MEGNDLGVTELLSGHLGGETEERNAKSQSR
jgi:hypothetical protein